MLWRLMEGKKTFCPSASLWASNWHKISWINCLLFCFYGVHSLKKRTSSKFCTFLSCFIQLQSVLLISCVFWISTYTHEGKKRPLNALRFGKKTNQLQIWCCLETIHFTKLHSPQNYTVTLICILYLKDEWVNYPVYKITQFTKLYTLP